MSHLFQFKFSTQEAAKLNCFSGFENTVSVKHDDRTACLEHVRCSVYSLRE
jgi:hypothetical protein